MITDPTGRDALEFNFLTSLGPVRQAFRRLLDRELAPLGVSLAQAQPLLRIHEHDAMRQRELAERLEIEGPTLVRLLDHLEGMGLVERRPDPDDHRAKTVHLTAAGASVVREMRPIIERLRRRLLADVSDEEIAICLGVFARVTSAVERDSSGTQA